jgi:hypothetical protein
VTTLSVWRAVWPLLLILPTTNCGWWEYYPQFRCQSPGGNEIRVVRNLRGYAADYKFRVEVSTTGGVTVVYRRERQSAIGLVEAYWSQDEKQVGVLVCDMLSDPVFVSYDLARHQMLSPLTFRPALEQQIRRKYPTADREDPVGWACSNAGSAAYQEITAAQKRVTKGEPRGTQAEARLQFHDGTSHRLHSGRLHLLVLSLAGTPDLRSVRRKGQTSDIAHLDWLFPLPH